MKGIKIKGIKKCYDVLCENFNSSEVDNCNRIELCCGYTTKKKMLKKLQMAIKLLEKTK